MITTPVSRLNTSAAAVVTSVRPLFRLLKLTFNRFHGAAQPQLDPDNCYCYWSSQETRGDHLVGSTPMVDTEGSVPLRGVQWAFIGSPRAKKHVYAEMLSKLLEVPHISTASLVRQELSPHSTLYKQIANAVNHGELVQEDTIFGLLSKRLEDGHGRGETGFILDGIPRSRIQAEILDQLAEIDLVVNFKCTEDLMMNTQGEASWSEKLQDYIKQIKPLEDYYKEQKKLLDFQVGSAHMETWRGLLTALHLQHMIAGSHSQKRTGGSILP
ncbi:probable adenylate kinase 7, mitochondrial [Durio zibethinus]|uniref:adenylate kinase n=1 Tax=Durio zibethinus TaxID=66656 RepID=A0A6P5Y730_DURZI|nr:probable adenylate kinase 7, mitochondrial [Durio zibethinus]XP_022736230.1 probable adenylate kinase 7, mitochondrial [Durio zibethinus]